MHVPYLNVPTKRVITPEKNQTDGYTACIRFFFCNATNNANSRRTLMKNNEYK